MTTKETSLRQCIKELSAKNTDYKHPEQAINQAESLKSLSSDLYTDNIRFIYELIQNADDAEAKNVILTILEDKYLIIAHNGKIFDEKDLQGLCGINNGTKKKDLDKTGYKGLGFKAVFGKSNKVIIYSNEEYFRFDSSYKINWNKKWGTNDQETWEKENDRQFIYPWQINPVWTNQSDIPRSIREFLSLKQTQIHVANIILLNYVEEIHLAIDLLKQQPYMFLFLRNISEMTFIAQTIDIISIDCDLNDDLKKIYFNQKVVSQWIIKRFELNVPDDVREKLSKDIKVPDKLRRIKKAEIFFAAKYKDPVIDRDGIVINPGRIEKLRDEELILFSYLPTKILEYKFPVLINANFLTNVNREQIHTDSVWNQWLFNRIGSKIIEWIKELVLDEKFRFQSYRLIPMKLNLTNNILSECFNKSFEAAVTCCSFILNRENQLLTVDEVIMDSTSMSEQKSFINNDVMRQYVINFYKYSFFICPENPFIDYDPDLHRIGVREFTWDNCIEMFKSKMFLKNHTIGQNIQMIEYFYSKSSNSGIHIEQIPFLMDQNNRLQLAKDIYFPAETILISKKETSDDLFIHKRIFDWLNEIASKEIKEWLQKLGITERTDLTYLYKTIVPNVLTYITPENSINTIEMLFILFQKDLIGKKDLNLLKQLKLLTIRGTLVSAEQCFFSEQFNPRLKLEEYLKEKEDKFLSFDYVTSSAYNDDLVEWRRFFTMLGVQEELSIIEFAQKLTISEAVQHGFPRRYLLRKSPSSSDLVDAYSGLKTITFLEHTENNYEFAKFFWSYVLKHIKAERMTQNMKIYWGHSNTRSATVGDDANYVKWFAENIKSIPTIMNTCDFPTNIFLETKEMKELCGQYMPFASVSLLQDKTKWDHVFTFKTKLSIDNYFDLLEKIRDDEKDLQNNLQRIQMIYSRILKEICSWSSQERINLRKRISKMYLLAENNQWKLANTLYIYKEDNETNSNLNDVIPCLKLDFMNKTNKNLQKFLDLFNIKPIGLNDLKLVDEKSCHAEEFRRKLIDISPFLKKWLQHLDFPKDTIASIDRVLQQNTHFIESDCLKLFYDGKFVKKTNVYNDIIHRKFYVTRPWKSETTFRQLPNKLCQLFNIEKFDDNLRFLLKAEREEIIKCFKDDSIEIPADKEYIHLKLLPKTEITQQNVLPNSSLSVSKESTSSVIDRTLSIDKKVIEPINKEIIDKSETPKSTIGSPNDTKHVSKDTWRQRHALTDMRSTTMDKRIRSLSTATIVLNNEQFDNIELIDISSIVTLTENPLSRIGGHDDLDLDTGFIGEQIIYNYLQKKYSSQTNSVYIKWENENSESHLPYDILLTENGRKHYIEVKSTRTNNQHSFPLSINQIEYILQYTENYFIYRVYIQDNQLIILDGIRRRLQKQQLTCFLTINSSSFDG